jgi:fused signal recognition particle receptor
MEIVVLLIVLAVVSVAFTLVVRALGRRRASRSGDDLTEPSAVATLEPPPVAPPSPAQRAPPAPVEAEVGAEVEVEPAPVVEEAPRVRPRLRDRLGKTRVALGSYVRGVRSRSRVDEEAYDDLEEALLLADVGLSTTTKLLDAVRDRAAAEQVGDAGALVDLVEAEVERMLDRDSRGLYAEPGERNVWMFVGVNGVGKTTTIAKVAAQQHEQGRSVLLVAADTFRAAAAEQLQTWADRTGAEVIRGQEGADPGSVVFDAMAAAGSRSTDVVLVDTAGRLHTKSNLMEELKKLRRIVDRTEGALKEVLLVIDAATGQNGLQQARQFAEAVDVTGIVLTKLDGTPKGGIVLAIEDELGIPVKLVGVGEGVDDLVEFDPREFAAAIFEA